MVTELLEGETLRERLVGARLPPRKALELAAQIARRSRRGARAGASCTATSSRRTCSSPATGGSKILDFGLAKLTAVGSPSPEATAAADTRAPAPRRGSSSGTVGYMSPEQVRGHAGRPPLGHLRAGRGALRDAHRAAAPSRGLGGRDAPAILREDPPDPAGAAACRRRSIGIVRRCLEKHAEERFQSARDLAFALESLSVESRTESRLVTEVDGVPVREHLRLRRLVAPVLVVALLAGAFALGRRSTARAMPTFTPLTFRRGTVLDARFTADGHTVVYSSLWDGNPPEIFSLRLDGLDSTSLRLPPARLLASRPRESWRSCSRTRATRAGAGRARSRASRWPGDRRGRSSTTSGQPTGRRTGASWRS